MGTNKKRTGCCLGACGCLVAIVGMLAILGFLGELEPEERLVDHGGLFDEPVEIPLDEGMEGAETSLSRNFYFIIDGSGSMKSEPSGACSGDQQEKTKLRGAQWAVQQFLEQVPDDVNIGLYIFDRDERREVVPLGTGNREQFMSQVTNIRAGGGTPLAPAIQYGTDRLVEQYQRQLGYGEYRLVVVTDGRAEKIPEAARYAAKYGMPIYAIGLCIGDDHPLRQFAVSYRAADSFDDLARGLEETLAELPAFDAAAFDDAGLAGGEE